MPCLHGPRCKELRFNSLTLLVDEVLCFAALLPSAETDLGSPISPVTSCADASRRCIAQLFKSESLGLSSTLEPVAAVARSWLKDPLGDTLPLASAGWNCVWWGAAGPEAFLPAKFLLDKGCCSSARHLRPSFSRPYSEGDRWDFVTDEGKARLDDAETDGDLL